LDGQEPVKFPDCERPVLIAGFQRRATMGKKFHDKLAPKAKGQKTKPAEISETVGDSSQDAFMLFSINVSNKAQYPYL
jgi:hypothetical protein